MDGALQTSRRGRAGRALQRSGVVLSSGLAILACAGPSYPLYRPEAAKIEISLPTLAGMTPETRAVWERYLRSSARWEIRSERGCTSAVRLERDSEGRYVSTLNGFVSDFGSPDVVQTRVLMGLGCEYGFGVDRGQIVRASALAGPTQLVLEDYMDQPGTQSVLILQGGAGLTLEIFEQAHGEARTFTRGALAEVEWELSQALAHASELDRQGYVEALIPEGSVEVGRGDRLVIRDGMQPGIYEVEAWVNPGGPDPVELRVFAVGPAPAGTPSLGSMPGDPPSSGALPEDVTAGAELSADRLRARSRRKMGYGPDPEVRFPYRSEITVYEGDWGEPYIARFELWQVGADERELIETVQVIEGWQR